MIVQDAVLRNEWIVACRSTDVLDRPTQVTIMGERIVLFRNEEGIHAFKDLCIHRGAALSLGCVRDGKLVCPYHGWEYESSGACVKIPQLPEDQAIPGKARAIPYACVERYGFIWVNLSNQSPEFYSLTQFDDDGYSNDNCGQQTVNAKKPSVEEN